MNQWQRIPKSRRYLTELVHTYIVKALQPITLWCIQPIQSWLYRYSSWGVVSLFLVGVSLSVVMAACSPRHIDNTGNAGAASQRDVTLTFVSYSVTNAAYQQIIPKFIEQWKKEHNQNITFNQSYDGSGSQTLAVIDGKEADVVHLSLALDINKLVEVGFIQPGWEKEAPNDAIVTKSVDAIAIREGNPKNIKTWADLARDGVNVVTPDPRTSGGARWNFLSLWGSVTKTGGNENQAIDFISKVYKNAPLLPKTARNATELFFKDNQGDVLLNYENEMILLAKNGKKISYIVPDVNISIDNPVAVVDKNVDKHGTRPIAEAFIKFLYTPESQREFTKLGFRPVDLTVTKEVEGKFPKIKTIFNAQDLGGWNEIQKKFFDEGAIFDKIRAKKS
ncbi:MAG: sulfate ABC transporter substrate-binding protein [Nostoc sp. NOS(2021)]|uniref:sulfate ABC transporter substrate-binding protein n=1 Tax=Nostoc sp. NOS(2021) TaxID=2815407 RepID=UPI0025E86D47|nr:sulfate ABC transporter substrate-binding protein [Nostoc sp. NOS(2021)]MBN3895068.1 sulfate ABC transporter substrate-binding protein [Nostoc sp. NOS(2021)]